MASYICLQYNKSCFQRLFPEIVKIITFMIRKGELIRGIHPLRNYVHAGKDCHSRFFTNKYYSTCFWMYDIDWSMNVDGTKTPNSKQNLWLHICWVLCLNFCSIDQWSILSAVDVFRSCIKVFLEPEDLSQTIVYWEGWSLLWWDAWSDSI